MGRLDGFILSRGEGRTIPLPAAAITFKATGETGTGDPFVAEMAAEPAFPGPGPHVHREHQELFYVLEGRFDFLVGDRTVRAEAGAFVVVPPHVVHDFRNPGPGLARALGIVTPGGFDRYFEKFHEMLTDGTWSPESFGRLRAEFATDELEIMWNSSPAGEAGTVFAKENAL